jgi:hypothetical protein
MRTFLVNFIYSSAGQANADLFLITQEHFLPHMRSTKKLNQQQLEKGLQLQGGFVMDRKLQN